MAWHGRLALHYRRDGAGRTLAHDRHDGPLRVLQALYPEGPGVCHHVLVHPPGGLVGGDRLDLDVRLDAGAHALLTTPGAARFYRSAGETALQSARLRLDAGARLEWLPLEAIAYDGCQAENQVRLELAPGAEAIGWDLLALGLPAAGAPFARGRFVQQLECVGAWLERGVIDGADTRLRDSPLGLAGRSVLATLWFAAGSALDEPRRDALLAAAREAPSGSSDSERPAGGIAEPPAGGDAGLLAGATAPGPRVVVLRALAPRVEPALQRLAAVAARWRQIAWQLAPCPPRVWRT